MNVTITNTGPTPVPVVTGSATPDGELVPILKPGDAMTIDDPAATVVSVGDNPTFFEEVSAALAGFAAVLTGILKALTQWWAEHHEKSGAAEGLPDPVKVQIENHGANAVRVILGSNTNDATVSPGATFSGEASKYIEFRELGV